MSIQTLVYLYNQRQLVVLFNNNNNPIRRYEKVYSKDLTVSKGVDNVIEFAFVNQEQRPINLQNKQITFRLISSDNNKIVLQKLLTPIYPITGLMSVSLTRDDLQTILASKCFYSLSIEMNGLNSPVFVDDFSGARGNITITDSVFPKFIKSTSITIPDHLDISQQNPLTYTSSVYANSEKFFITVQYNLFRFTGDIIIEGSNIPNFANPYVIETFSYTNNSNCNYINLEGYHSYIRFKIINIGTLVDGVFNGDVNQILVR